MPWCLKGPGHQQAWYWPNKPEYSVSNIRRVDTSCWLIWKNKKYAIFSFILLIAIFKSEYLKKFNFPFCLLIAILRSSYRNALRWMPQGQLYWWRVNIGSGNSRSELIRHHHNDQANCYVQVLWSLTLNVRGPSYLGLTSIMAADALAPYVARTSATLILTI